MTPPKKKSTRFGWLEVVPTKTGSFNQHQIIPQPSSTNFWIQRISCGSKSTGSYSGDPINSPPTLEPILAMIELDVHRGYDLDLTHGQLDVQRQADAGEHEAKQKELEAQRAEVVALFSPGHSFLFGGKRTSKYGCGSKFKSYAGVGLRFHLFRGHFGYILLSHGHMSSSAKQVAFF